MSDEAPEITLECPELCKIHTGLLVHQANFSRNDPWRVLIVVAQIALFQAATSDERTYKKIGDDIKNIKNLGCLACYKPDAFGEIVEAAKTHDLGLIKNLGIKWVDKAVARASETKKPLA